MKNRGRYASIAALCLACAEDRILEPDAICGDGRQDGAEQCDVASPGCAGCRIVYGWECNTETCTTACGDGIVAGEEECDPPDQLTCSGSCTAAAKPEACDMTGYWIARQTDFSIDNVVSQVQTSSLWHFFRIEQSGSSFEIAQSLFCGTEVTGSVRVTLTPGGLRGLIYRNPQQGSATHPARRGIFEVDGENCSFTLERSYAVRGVEDRFLPADFPASPELASLEPMPSEDNPEHDPSRPFGQNLEGAVDDDGDGNPGIAWQLSGNLTGTRNTAQRDYTEYFPHPDFVINQHAIEFVARGTFANQENILHVSDCPAFGCGLLLGLSVPAQNLAHRIMFRYLGQSPSEPRVAAVLVNEPRANIEDDLRTCENLRAALPHDPAKE